MSRVTQVVFYQDSDGTSPVHAWLLELKRRQRRAFAKCVVRIRRLAQLGYELRRPDADYLRDGIYELRAREGRVNYRILYFFHGQDVAVLAHSLTKESQVPATEIERAIRRMNQFRAAPDRHSYREEISDD